jgi:hypothetical protein
VGKGWKIQREVNKMSIWDKYPNLPPQELHTLVNVTAQVLLDSEGGQSTFSADLLERSPAAISRELAPLLQEAEPPITRQQVRELLEDEELSAKACRQVLDQVRGFPELADRIARAYEIRNQKLVGVELTLLAGALVILAIKVKEIRWGKDQGGIQFEPAGEAVKTFVAELAKRIVGLG